MNLILHSDDFGLHKDINRAILEAAGQGVLTSTSLLVNGPAAREAMEEVKSYPLLGVGIHLNILRGKPLSDPTEIPTLVDSEGLFLNSAWRLLLRSAAGKVSTNHVYKEYRRQILFMMEHELMPTHFDAEKHTHILVPEAVWALKKLMTEFGIKKIRTINESPINTMLRSVGVPLNGSIKQRLKLPLLEYRSRAASKQWEGFKSTDFSFGVLISGRIAYPHTVEILKAIFRLQSPITLEWMFHLGYPADLKSKKYRRQFGSFFLVETRREELRFILARETLEEIEANKERLMSYREL